MCVVIKSIFFVVMSKLVYLLYIFDALSAYTVTYQCSFLFQVGFFERQTARRFSSTDKICHEAR